MLKFTREELTPFGKIIFSIPFLIKRVERKSKIFDDYIEKWQQFRIVHPVAWIIFLVFILLYIITYLIDGWIKEWIKDFPDFIDIFTLI